MNNNACLGYMILAAKELELHEKVICALQHQMFTMMDEYTEEEAEQVYKTS